jgi:sphinganine-1-phosphate aldolase
MVVPTTVHAAFAKAAHYFGVERIAIDVDPVTRRADVPAMAMAMDAHGDRVVLVAASAPSYAHGVVDPIGELAAETSARGLRLHVDPCIGGWVLPWAERLGHAVEPWDFRVAGVTSISADLHKYAYTPKGVSLLPHATPTCAAPSTSRVPTGPGTRCSTAPRGRRSPADRSPRPGPS